MKPTPAERALAEKIAERLHSDGLLRVPTLAALSKINDAIASVLAEQRAKPRKKVKP